LSSLPYFISPFVKRPHFDHSEGLLKAVELIREQNGQRSVPLHLHPGVFVHRAIQLASGERLPLQDVPSAEALSESGYLLVESSKEEEILDEVFFLSGEIPRTSFERGMGNQVRLMPSGNWEPVF
jgi:7,8-dihydropterin-6-yl-methyl-4-(beta-D-ribofuranosyl)aminobenzene 5'-phosphate synthase